MLKIGDRLPDITLPSKDGALVRLHDLLGKKALVVYFYPKDMTAGCTRQACAFRDDYPQFAALGAEVIGISQDSGQSHRDFAEAHQLPFVLLSDEQGIAYQAFGLRDVLGAIKNRVTFVADSKGNIRFVYASLLRFGAHSSQALDVVKTLQRESQ